MPEPLVSVIIVNHNGIKFVNECLRSVFNCLYGNLEVIFVDNGSTDGSLGFVKKNFSRENRLRFVVNKESVGPAVGRNRGAKASRGKYLIFFDNDTSIDKDCIKELTQLLEADNSIGSAQAKLLRMDTDKLYDCAGDYLGPLGFLIERSRGAKDQGQLDFVADILSAKSAASIIRRDLFEQVGGFDEDFYMYLEETDLSWRVWLSGYRVTFCPSAIAYHAFNTPRKDFVKDYSKYVVRYFGCRNYITTLIKNLEIRNLLKILPLHLASWFTLAFFFLMKGNLDNAFYVLKGIGWNIVNAGRLAVKRRFINKFVRKTCDKNILNRVQSKQTVGYYISKALAYTTGRAF